MVIYYKQIEVKIKDLLREHLFSFVKVIQQNLSTFVENGIYWSSCNSCLWHTLNGINNIQVRKWSNIDFRSFDLLQHIQVNFLMLHHNSFPER